MSIFHNKDDIRAESLEEILAIAEYCVSTQKPVDNHPRFYGGVYGYPATILLLTSIDSMGKYLAQQSNVYLVMVDNNKVKITKDNTFRILNSCYFDLSLSEIEIEFIFQEFRNGLMHEAILDKVILIPSLSGTPFEFVSLTGEKNEKGRYSKLDGQMKVWLPALLAICKEAWTKFNRDFFTKTERIVF